MKEKDSLNAAIGSRIKELRKKEKLTQEQLSELVNLGTPQQISEIERGLCGVSVAKLVDFCRVLNTGADYLLFGISDSNTSDILNSSDLFNKYLSKMTPEQTRYAEELIAVYTRSCGIK